MDRALWISWYDLAPESDAYLDWLHRTYIPKVVRRSGVLWAAHYASVPNVSPLGGGKGRVSRHASSAEVPSGERYILIFGASGSCVYESGRTRIWKIVSKLIHATRLPSVAKRIWPPA